MKKIAFNVMLAASLFTTVACNETKKDDSTEMADEQNEAKFDKNMEDDTEFAVDAANAGMMEVRLGELAASNSSSAEVKEFARMMVTDHTQGNKDLKAMAEQKNISLPATLGSDMQSTYDDMAEKTGKEFDKDYVDLMVKDHKKVIDMFKEEAQDGKNADIKAWASNAVSTLEMHLQKAEALQEAM